MLIIREYDNVRNNCIQSELKRCANKIVPTRSEQALAEALQRAEVNFQFKSIKFKRDIGFVVDFFIIGKRTVINIGNVRIEGSVVEYNVGKFRKCYPKWKIVCFNESEILENADMCVDFINSTIKGGEKGVIHYV